MLGRDESKTGRTEPPLVNIDVGKGGATKELAEIVAKVVGFGGELVFDTSKQDGMPGKLMDIGVLRTNDWAAFTPRQRVSRRLIAPLLTQSVAITSDQAWILN